MSREYLSCPFCGIATSTEYDIMLHVEIRHPERSSSLFSVQEDSCYSTITDNGIVPEQLDSCDIYGFKKNLPVSGLENHICTHQENNSPGSFNYFKDKSKSGIKSSLNTEIASASNTRQQQIEILSKSRGFPDRKLNYNNASKPSLREPKSTPTPVSSSQSANGGLGKSDLGPHAHESKMPAWLMKLLKDEDGIVRTVKKVQNGKVAEVEICPNMVAGIISNLALLLRQNKSTQNAYLCHSSVKHISRLKREGGFCGYRNIQMMTSYIISTKSQGHEVFVKKIPSIFDIQDYIEMAWDTGINSHGRVETNGIRGTRKYIGTSDAQAMFYGLGIPCDVESIVRSGSENKSAHEILLSKVEDYFSCHSLDEDSKVRNTYLPPIYLQHSGHSMTIVGFEKRKDKSKSLLVLDPKYHDPSRIIELIRRTSYNHSSTESILGTYIRGVSYLKKYNAFELLKLSSPMRKD